MHILFMAWETFADIDIVNAMKQNGHKVSLTNQKPNSNTCDPSFEKLLQSMILDNQIDCVFSSNYYPVISNACDQINIHYIAWVYDSPQLLLYDKSITNPCNAVFLFDKVQYQTLKDLAIDTVFFLPLAVDTDRLATLSVTPEDLQRYPVDIAFVGSLYNEEHTLYDRMAPRLDDYTRGYLEGIMNAQRNVYGYFLLEDALNASVLSAMEAAMPYEKDSGSYITNRYLYANYFLGRKLATIERLDILSQIANRYPNQLAVYTTGDTSSITGLINRGTVTYYDEMPKAFALAKINLNISLRTIQSGIPLRAFDIMGAGGFLLTNYQADFMDFFVPGEDYVYYESVPDLFDKIHYYLEHEEERIAIAQNGYQKICANHTYKKRIQEIFNLLP